MTGAIRFLWRQHRAALIAFALALALTLFLAARLALAWVYWSDPARRDLPIEGWMTPGYVARSYRVPPETIREALKVTPERGHPRNLDELAREAGQSTGDLIASIEAAIAAARAGQ